MITKMDELEIKRELSLNRWRLVLGKDSGQSLDFSGDESQLKAFADMEQLLDYLYGRGGSEDISKERRGGSEDSRLTAAKWINKVRTLFPKKTAEVLEKHALEEFHLAELITDKKVLESLKPDMGLLKAVLQLKHLMKGEVLETAKKVAGQVADELSKKLE